LTKTIVQQVKFAAAPGTLFGIYMDSKKHSAAIGSKAKVGREVGSTFEAWDGYITGKMLAVFPKRAIVQTWRGSDWAQRDADSILTLAFDKAPGGALLTLVQANVPDDAFAELDRGWVESYWQPWKEYLGRK
jgi:activator of HSP90 ATPase